MSINLTPAGPADELQAASRRRCDGHRIGAEQKHNEHDRIVDGIMSRAWSQERGRIFVTYSVLSPIRSRVMMEIPMASASAGRSARNVERRPQEPDRPVTPVLFRPFGQPVSTNMHLFGRSRLDVRLECFHAAGSADSAVLITDLRR